MNIRKTMAARLALIGLVAVVLVGCAAPAAPFSSAARESGGTTNGYDASEAPMAPALPQPAATAVPAAAPGQPADQAQPRLIIRTADLTIVVKNTDEQLAAISKLAAQYGGFVVQSGTSKVSNETQGQITVRVDAKNFDTAISDIRKLAVDVRSENVRGEDVTAEFVDLEAQLKNLEAAEAQLQKIMENAVLTEDVLNVYQRLTEIRGQIDQIKGRMKYLSQSAALSTINVSLIPDALAQPVEVGGWKLEGVLKSAVETLISTMQVLATLVINLIVVALPVIVIFALPVVALIWVTRRLQKRRPAKPVA